MQIRSCISTSRVSVLVNGSPTDEFSMESGLRQWDLLSPFLFIITAEAIQAMVVEDVRAGLYNPYSIGSSGIQVLLLQFADDILFLGEWSYSNVGTLLKLLKCFEEALGLMINLNKSSLTGVGVTNAEAEKCATRFHCKAITLPFTYLGQPVGNNMHRVAAWSQVEKRFSDRKMPQKCNTISIGGRLTLVHSILNSLPLYFFSLFKAPSSVLK